MTKQAMNRWAAMNYKVSGMKTQAQLTVLEAQRKPYVRISWPALYAGNPGLSSRTYENSLVSKTGFKAIASVIYRRIA